MMKKTIPDFESIPQWYGVAYYDHLMRWSICYPFGVHLLVRWAHSLYWWLVWKRPQAWECELLEAANKARKQASEAAYDAGFATGKRVGIEIGYNTLYDEIEASVTQQGSA